MLRLKPEDKCKKQSAGKNTFDLSTLSLLFSLKNRSNLVQMYLQIVKMKRYFENFYFFLVN